MESFKAQGIISWLLLAIPVVTQQDLDFILDCQVRELSKILITNYYLCLDIQNNILLINVPESADMQEVESQQQAISTAAYLKLGCKKISFYCYQTWLWDYNADIRIDEFDNMTAAVLSSPTVETQSELDQPIQQPQSQVAIDWISFDGIAQSLGIPPQTISNEVESYGIFVTLYRNQLGLSSDNLENYLNRRHTEMVARFRGMLAKQGQPTTSQTKSLRATTKLQAVPDNNKPSNGFVPNADGGLSLPDGFNIMEGRTRKPPVLTALKIAVDALPDGKDPETRKMYVRQIAMRENVENFLGALSSQFESSQKFKSIAATSKEICNAARQLWDEYLDSAPA